MGRAQRAHNLCGNEPPTEWHRCCHVGPNRCSRGRRATSQLRFWGRRPRSQRNCRPASLDYRPAREKAPMPRVRQTVCLELKARETQASAYRGAALPVRALPSHIYPKRRAEGAHCQASSARGEWRGQRRRTSNTGRCRQRVLGSGTTPRPKTDWQATELWCHTAVLAGKSSSGVDPKPAAWQVCRATAPADLGKQQFVWLRYFGSTSICSKCHK